MVGGSLFVIFHLLLMISFVAPSGAFALTSTELSCQSTIGQQTREFAIGELDTLVRCNNKVAGGGTCDQTHRDAKIARLKGQFEREIRQACHKVTLTNLGFPGSCPSGGGTFATNDLLACLEDALKTQTDMALAVEYPALTALSGSERQCQSAIGSDAQIFMSRKLRARCRCLDLQLGGHLSPAVVCRAEVPPGTGRKATDKLITQATKDLADGLRKACRGITLEHLGFPGACADSSGGSFSLEDLQACVLSTHEANADTIVALVYPPTPVPTSTPTGTPTGVGGTPTETPTPTPTPTATPTTTPS
jgi:hypothetical protein